MKDNTDLIEAYLNNEMLGEELLSFENRLKIDTELAEEVALHSQIRGFVKENEVENLKIQVKDWLKEDEKDENTIDFKPKFEQKSKIFSFSNFAKIAAAVVFVAGLSWYFFSSKTSENIESQYLAELTNEAPIQQQGADDRTNWSQAYREKKYKKVISLLSAKKNPTAEESYYLGLALSADNQFEKALVELSKSHVIKSVYAEKAEWAKALIYLKLYKKAEAKMLLKKIGESDSQYRDLSLKIEL